MATQNEHTADQNGLPWRPLLALFASPLASLGSFSAPFWLFGSPPTFAPPKPWVGQMSRVIFFESFLLLLVPFGIPLVPFGMLLASFWLLLASCWDPLPPFWDPSDPFSGLLGAFWLPLGFLLARFGRLLATFWPPLGFLLARCGFRAAKTKSKCEHGANKFTP